MSIKTSHIIKKTDVAASRAVRPDPTVLLSALRIPARRVEVEKDSDAGNQSHALGRIIQGEEAEEMGDSLEIFTRRSDVKPPDPRDVQTEAANEEEPEGDHEPTPEELEAEWVRRLDAEVARAREEAFEEGRASIRDEASKTIDELRHSFARDLDAVQGAWEEHLKGSRIQLVQLAFRIAGVILDAPLPPSVRAISESIIREAVDSMSDGIPVEVSLHPVSFLRIQEAGIEDQLAAINSKIRWRSDPNLKENEWVVQSSRSAVRRLEAELLDQLQRELSLRDVEPPETGHPQNGDDASDQSSEL